MLQRAAIAQKRAEREVRYMTDKQKRFADEYLIDCNATRAYKAAYPRVKKDETASVNASRLLSKAKVKEYIDKKLNEISSAKIADATEVMEYLTSVLRGESRSEIVVVEGCGEGVSSARSIEKAPDEKDRLKAAEMLGKRYGLYTDKVDLDGAVSIVISGENELED